MTQKIGKQPPPQALEYFLILAEGLEAPPEVRPALTLLREVVFAGQDGKPFRERLNRRVGQARRQHPEQFTALADWTFTEAVFDLCRSRGGLHAWQTCLQAFRAIVQGESAHKAFGMHRPGRPPSARITPAQEAAALATHLIQKGVPVEAAQTEARLTVDPDANGKRNRLDQRTIQRHRVGVAVSDKFAETITQKS